MKFLILFSCCLPKLSCISKSIHLSYLINEKWFLNAAINSSFGLNFIQQETPCENNFLISSNLEVWVSAIKWEPLTGLLFYLCWNKPVAMAIWYTGHICQQEQFTILSMPLTHSQN